MTHSEILNEGDVVIDKYQFALFQELLAQREAQKRGVCGCERPPRKVLCQLNKNHREDQHMAVVFWEKEAVQ